MQLVAQQLLKTLQAHPLLYTCFAKYITWFCANDVDEWEKYQLMKALCERRLHVISELESSLTISRETPGLTESDFATQFAFTDDLLTEDPPKIHDLLAEVLFVNNLTDLRFTSIRRPQVKVKGAGRAPKSADFTAWRFGAKFAIEVKTIRSDRKGANGRALDFSRKPPLAQSVFQEDVVKKINSRERHVIQQLQATARQEDCDHTLLAIYYGKEGIGAVMRKADYRADLAAISRQYPEIDYFISKSFNGGCVAEYPELPVSAAE
jgi:hypothetical protein